MDAVTIYQEKGNSETFQVLIDFVPGGPKHHDSLLLE